jgi:phenylacetate-CoA ligase
MSYVSRVLSMVARRSVARYRYFLHWQAEERRARAFSPERLRAMQWRKLRKMLHFAGQHVPFYRERFRETGIRPEEVRTEEDLLRIPVLTKEDIRRNFPDRLLAEGRRFTAGKLGQTSGSTGESLHFVRPEDSWRRSLEYSVLLRTKRLSNVPVLVLATPICTAATCSLSEAESWFGLPVRRLHKTWFLRHLHDMIGLPSSENILAESDDYMGRLAEILHAYSPCMVIADPVYLGSFARYLRHTGGPVPRVRHVLSTYELLTDTLRDTLSEVFGCDVFTQYGSSEINDMANECEHHRLHVRTSNVLIEAMRDGEPARPGEVGRAIVTDLTNYNMPFIRYDIGDVIEPGEPGCRCGRNSETIEAVHGRVGDTIAMNGAGRSGVLTPLQADAIFGGLSGIAAYRLVQTSAQSYDISLMPDRSADQPDRQALLRRFRSLLGDGSVPRVEKVDTIRPERSMKFRFVYSEVSSAQL